MASRNRFCRQYLQNLNALIFWFNYLQKVNAMPSDFWWKKNFLPLWQITFDPLKNGLKQDSKALSPRPLANAPQAKNSKCSKCSNTQFSKFQTCLKFLSMFKMCLKYSSDTKWHNHINSCHFKTSLNMFSHITKSAENIKLWCNLFLKPPIQIDTIL